MESTKLCCWDFQALFRFLTLFEMLREIVICSIVILYCMKKEFELIFYFYAINFLTFMPSLYLATAVYFKFNRPSLVEKSIPFYYKVKLTSTIAWLLESICMLLVRGLLRIELSTLVVEAVFLAIGISIDFAFVCSVRSVYNIAVQGEPMQPAQLGHPIEVKDTVVGPPMIETFIVESTEICELGSYPTKKFFAEKNVPENKEIIIQDFTLRKNSDHNHPDSFFVSKDLKIVDLNTINN